MKVTYSHISECHTSLHLLLLQIFQKERSFLEDVFHKDICIRFFIFPKSVFSLKVFIVFRLGLVNVNMSVTFYFIFCSMTAFFLGHAHLQWPLRHIQSSSLTCPIDALIFQDFVGPPWGNIFKDFILIIVLRFPNFCWNTKRLVTENRRKTPSYCQSRDEIRDRACFDFRKNIIISINCTFSNVFSL